MVPWCSTPQATCLRGPGPRSQGRSRTRAAFPFLFEADAPRRGEPRAKRVITLTPRHLGCPAPLLRHLGCSAPSPPCRQTPLHPRPPFALILPRQLPQPAPPTLARPGPHGSLPTRLESMAQSPFSGEIGRAHV